MQPMKSRNMFKKEPPASRGSMLVRVEFPKATVIYLVSLIALARCYMPCSLSLQNIYTDSIVTLQSEKTQINYT